MAKLDEILTESASFILYSEVEFTLHPKIQLRCIRGVFLFVI